MSNPTGNRLAVLALLLAVLSGCGQGHLPQGPLGAWPENHDTVGQPVLRGGADTIGFDGFYNGGTKPAVIDRVVIVSPRHIKLHGAYVTIGGIIGNWTSFPPAIPAHGNPESRLWATRHKAAGAVIPPHQQAGLALGLSATAAHGSLARTDVYYHVGNTHYEWRGNVRIVLTSVDCRAPSNKSARSFCRAYGP